MPANAYGFSEDITELTQNKFMVIELGKKSNSQGVSTL